MEGWGLFLVFGIVDLACQSRGSKRGSAHEQAGNPRRDEGNGRQSAEMKSRIRRIRRDLARRRMMKEVATATAVVVNPTHYAVATEIQSGIARRSAEWWPKARTIWRSGSGRGPSRIRYRSSKILRWRRGSIQVGGCGTGDPGQLLYGGRRSAGLHLRVMDGTTDRWLGRN